MTSEPIHHFFLSSAEAAGHPMIGGKARSLAWLTGAGFPVPAWMVLLPGAFEAAAALATSDWPDLLTKNPAAFPEWVRRLSLPAGSAAALGARLKGFPMGTLFAVRSSALDEDGVEHSFAGQLDSFLFVPPTEVHQKIAMVWASAFSPRMFAYRKGRGMGVRPSPPAVIIQEMIPAEKAGVAFSCDPVSGRRSVQVVSSVWGLGSGLVSGECDSDTWEIQREQIVRRMIGKKTTAHQIDAQAPEGVSAVVVPEDRVNVATLEDGEILNVARLALQAASFFRRPQDIEWCFHNGQLHLLQSRPITSIGGLPDPEGALTLWDNSNIAESYNGVTTPLTFSFARMAYAAVYEEFCRLMRVPESRIKESRPVFRQMLGYLQGRIYYNLVNWYRVLALLPGFQVNRKFMEQMMGVKEELPSEILAGFGPPAGFWERARDSVHLSRTVAGLIWNHLTIERQIRNFQNRLNQALEHKPPLSALRIDQLAAEYLSLEQKLLTRWDAPLVNDFLAMIFFGVLRGTCKAWVKESDLLANDLLSGEGGIISMEPARRVREMAEVARQDPSVVESLSEQDADEAMAALKRLPLLQQQFQSYLSRFGERCLEELKLETITLEENPLPLLRSIGHSAKRPASQGNVVEGHLRSKAEQLVKTRLARRPFKRLLFGWILQHARARVRSRENLRFERTRAFGRVRKIMVEMGARLTAENKLEQPRDVFYLSLEEILGFIDGTAVTTDLKSLVELRKREAGRWRADHPSDRFETRGAVHVGNSFIRTEAPMEASGSKGQRQGIGCCPGVVRGKARVILHPDNAEIHSGEILVAPRTDPGWILLFPSAAGLLVEHGSLLSHSAIVAREMGLPAVVSIAGLTEWLKTGDEVELDGATGLVRKIEFENP